MLRSRTRLLRCKIERIEGDEAFISAEQDDLTPANGLTLLSELTTDMRDPRFSLSGGFERDADKGAHSMAGAMQLPRTMPGR
jgi:hypothetical protein